MSEEELFSGQLEDDNLSEEGWEEDLIFSQEPVSLTGEDLAQEADIFAIGSDLEESAFIGEAAELPDIYQVSDRSSDISMISIGYDHVLMRDQPLDQLWDGLIAGANQIIDHSRVVIEEARNTIKTSSTQVKEMRANFDIAWPDESILKIGVQRPSLYLWMGSAQRLVRDYQARQRTVLFASLKDLEWRRETAQRAWKNRYRKQTGLLKRKLKELDVPLRSAERKISWFMGTWQAAHNKASWLLAFPLDQLVRPTGLAQWLPVGRANTHYHLSQIQQIYAVQRQYKQILKSEEELHLWLPVYIQALISLESSKVDFYLANLHRSPGRIHKIARNAAQSAEKISPLPDQWAADIASMDRLARQV